MKSPRPLRASIIICAFTCAVFACALAMFVWGSVTETGKVSLALSASSTIPYVTDTEPFLAYLRTALAGSDPETVQMYLKELYADEQHGEQHMSLHYFGEVLYQDMGADALPFCKDWYGYGCYHGFLLSAIDTEGYQVVPSLDAACIQTHGRTMETETCQHGIGHGLAEFSGRDPHEAVEACDLVDDVFPKLGCVSGVFMEYFAPTQSDKHTLIALRPAFDGLDPFNVCDEFSGLSLSTCLFEIQSWWQDIAQLPPRTVEALCNSVEDAEAREFCLIGYGNFKGPTVSAALPYCDEFVEPESHALCRAGILWAGEHHYDPPDADACGGLTDEYRALCLKKGRFSCEVEKNCKP